MYQDEDHNYPEFQPSEDENNSTSQQFPWNYDTPYQPPVQKKVKKGWTGGKIVLLALCCGLLGGLLGFGGTILGARLMKNGGGLSFGNGTSIMQEGVREDTVIDITEIDTGKLMTAAEVYAKNVNSTVGITTSISTNYWGYQTTSAASGSGFILTADGYVLTNYHVVEGSDSITVSLYNGDSFDAEMIGYDEGNDIAVLKVNAEGLTPVVLGDSDNLNVGDSVIAIGNPLGELTFSLTAGTISAKDRQITMSTGATMNLMQTDCAINSGNSGGALFNLYGEVIGITNAKYSTSSSSEASIDNIGFAIPINHVREIVTSIIEKGYIAKPYVGVSVTDVSVDAQRYGLPKGASIVTIVEDSPAAQAGLAVNDIITEANGKEISSRNDFVSLVGKSQIGDVMNLKVYRSGEYVDITLTIGEQVQSALEEEPSVSTEDFRDLFPWGNLIPGF